MIQVSADHIASSYQTGVDLAHRYCCDCRGLLGDSSSESEEEAAAAAAAVDIESDEVSYIHFSY